MVALYRRCCPTWLAPTPSAVPETSGCHQLPHTLISSVEVKIVRQMRQSGAGEVITRAGWWWCCREEVGGSRNGSSATSSFIFFFLHSKFASPPPCLFIASSFLQNRHASTLGLERRHKFNATNKRQSPAALGPLGIVGMRLTSIGCTARKCTFAKNSYS